MLLSKAITYTHTVFAHYLKEIDPESMGLKVGWSHTKMHTSTDLSLSDQTQ